MDKNYISTWLAEIRANFLILSVVLVMIGAAAAWNDGSFNSVLFLLTVFGVVSVHISVNLFNEYSDWRTGIDENTDRNSFRRRFRYAPERASDALASEVCRMDITFLRLFLPIFSLPGFQAGRCLF